FGPDDAVPRVRLLRLGRSRDGGSPSARFLRQAPDRPTDALVRAMARHRTADADSGSSRTQLIHPTPFRRRESSLSSSEGAQPRFGLSILVPIECDDDMIGHRQFQTGFKFSAADLPVRLSATTS